MILALDVGNSQIYGGVFEGDELKLSFRKNSKQGNSSDEIGLFLKAVLHENKIAPERIQSIAICSVVPDLVYSLRGACRKYFDLNPFILQAGTRTGLKIKYRNPLEVGADRIANAIAAAHLYPGKNLVVVDMGTATTFCAINADKDYLGGIIVPGLRIAMESLEANTAKLPAVEILSPTEAIGRSTVESIQSGLYYGTVGMIRELSLRIRQEGFAGQDAFVIGTGGFSRMFEKEKVFDALVPDLVLIGLNLALRMNA